MNLEELKIGEFHQRQIYYRIMAAKMIVGEEVKSIFSIMKALWKEWKQGIDSI